MSKILGEGYVRKSGRICVILEKLQNRLVDLPDTALRLNYDKRFYEPEHGDHLIFSAQMQNGRYSAVSAVRPSDLLSLHGCLSYFDENLKFGHVSVQGRTAKVFVPFSTRTTNGVCWYGHGAFIDKPYVVHVFRQEEAHGCKFVAWAIYEDTRKPATLPPQHLDVYQSSTMKRLGSTSAVQRQSDHQSVEFVQLQSGVIYDVSDTFVVSVTSPTCQNVEFAAHLYESWMKPGRFLTFDGRRVSDVKTSKLMGSNAEDIGSVFAIRRLAPLTISVSAVLNKVSHGKAAWAWNDHVGRIYVPWNSTDRYMTPSKPFPFTPVHLEIAYNGKHDDIPWVASSSSLCEEHEYDRIVEENSRMLRTEDNWKIQSVVDGPENPSIFLQKLDENGKKRCAFAKVIDLNSGNIPATGTLVRITYYNQERHGRHAMRCVLVTSMEKVERLPRVHLVVNGSGTKHFPMLYEQPTPKRVAPPPGPQPKIQAAPPPVKNCWNMKNLGSPKSPQQDFPAVTETKEEKPVVEAEPVCITPPPGLAAPPGLPPLTTTPRYPIEYNEGTTPIAPMMSLENGHLRLGSVWSGTPVEAKPEENSPFFSHENFLNSPFAPIGSSFSMNTDTFLADIAASVSQPSTSSGTTSGPISDLRNTQSEASSPGLKSEGSEVAAEEQPNCWSSLEAATSNTNTFNSSFSFGFPLLDLPIYQRMLPTTNDVFLPSTSLTNGAPAPPPVDPLLPEADVCPCGNEQLLWDLWQNPKFVAAFSASDPETFEKINNLRHSFNHVRRH